MKKGHLLRQPGCVSKSEKLKNVWKKRIMQKTELTEKSAEWIADRVETLTDYMQYGCALIAYRRQNGEFYMGKGTLIHYEHMFHKKYDMECIQSHVVYWDIEQQGWRTFQLENFLEWKPIVN